MKLLASRHHIGHIFITCLFVFILQVSSGLAWARGVTPYLPLNLSPEIEAKIERVLILGDRAVIRRPIAAATVLDALPAACKRDAALCEEVRSYLRAYMRGSGITHAAATLSLSQGATVALPNQHGKTSDSHGELSIAAYAQPSDYLLLSVGGVVNEDSAAPTGTMLSIGNAYMQLDAGYRDRWTSPFTDSAMLISTEAPTMPSLTLSNYEGITPLNLRYEFSVSQESQSDHIATATGFTQGNPRIANLHLEIAPVPGWSLGVDRLAQYGGGSRGGGSLRSIYDALINPASNDNRAEGATVDQEQGNQQASFVSSFIYPGKTPMVVYFEYAGEDTSRFLNYLLGNSSLAAGVHFPSLWRKLDLTYEISEWQNGWYQHHIYQDGVVNQGFVLGHWGGDWPTTNGVGARTNMLQMSYEGDGARYLMRYRNIRNAGYSQADYRVGHDLTLGYSRKAGQFNVGGELELGKDVYGKTYGLLSGFVRFAPGASLGSGLVGGDASGGTETTESERFVQLGYGRHRVVFDPNDPPQPKSYTATTGLNVGLGVRRRTGMHSDFGARIEFDQLANTSLISVRALDYRYRLGKHAALSAFMGASRYAAQTPALGWYFGAGVQWRNLLPSMDLSIDYRSVQGLQRDHLLAGEPTARPDEYYSVTGFVTNLSYRF